MYQTNISAMTSLWFYGEKGYSFANTSKIRNNYRIKLYELCKSNGIVLQVCIYSGKSENIDKEIGHATQVVLNLMDDYLDKW